MLIPHTLERTNLHDLSVEQIVNVEFDLTAKIIVQRTEEIMAHAESIR